MKIILRVKKNNKCVRRLISRNGLKRRRLFAILASAKPQSHYFIRVEYGKDKDNFGHNTLFYNEYIGENKTEAKQSLQAFLDI
jgi:hypothetical protein